MGFEIEIKIKISNKGFFMLFVIAIYLYFTLQPIKKNIELLKYMLLEVNKQSFSQ